MGSAASTHHNITPEQFTERARLIQSECMELTKIGVPDSEILGKLRIMYDELTLKYAKENTLGQGTSTISGSSNNLLPTGFIEESKLDSMISTDSSIAKSSSSKFQPNELLKSSSAYDIVSPRSVKSQANEVHSPPYARKNSANEIQPASYTRKKSANEIQPLPYPRKKSIGLSPLVRTSSPRSLGNLQPALSPVSPLFQNGINNIPRLSSPSIQPILEKEDLKNRFIDISTESESKYNTKSIEPTLANTNKFQPRPDLRIEGLKNAEKLNFQENFYVGNPLLTRRLSFNKTLFVNYTMNLAVKNVDSTRTHERKNENEDKDSTSMERSSLSLSAYAIGKDPITGTVIPSFEARCFLCNMVFLNKARLDRHIKFSEMHSKNLVQHEENQVVELTASSLSSAFRGISMDRTADGGILIYEGPEYFTKTGDNIYIHMFMHEVTKLLEVVPYDMDDEMELSRVYFSIKTFFNIIGHDVMNNVASDLEKQLVDNTINISHEVQKQSSKLLALAVQTLRHLEVVRGEVISSPTRAQRSSSSIHQFMFSEDKFPLSIAAKSHSPPSKTAVRSPLPGFAKQIRYKTNPEDKSKIDPTVIDPYIPKTVVVRSSNLKKESFRRTDKDVAESKESSVIETVQLSSRHLQDAVIAAGIILDLPQKSPSKFRRKAGSLS